MVIYQTRCQSASELFPDRMMSSSIDENRAVGYGGQQAKMTEKRPTNHRLDPVDATNFATKRVGASHIDLRLTAAALPRSIAIS